MVYCIHKYIHKYICTKVYTNGIYIRIYVHTLYIHTVNVHMYAPSTPNLTFFIPFSLRTSFAISRFSKYLRKRSSSELITPGGE